MWSSIEVCSRGYTYGPLSHSLSLSLARFQSPYMQHVLGYLVASVAQLRRVGSQMQEVRGSNPRLGGLRVGQFQASGGIGTLQSRASDLRSATQGIPSGPKQVLRLGSRQKQLPRGLEGPGRCKLGLPTMAGSRLLEGSAALAPRAALVLVVLGVFSDLFSATRVFDGGDDGPNYTENALLRAVEPGGWGPRLLEIYHSEGTIGVWEPVAIVLKLVLVQAFGLHARTFMGAAVALHAAGCWLAMELALRAADLLGPGPAGGKPTTPHAWAAALLLGIHPLRVEALAWASCLPYEISTIFVLLACLCHMRHRARWPPPAARPFGPWRLASAVLLLLGCNAKAAALGLAAALLLLDLGSACRWP